MTDVTTTMPGNGAGFAAQTVAEIAAGLPGATAVFRRRKLDFCCGGKVPLAEAAAARGVPLPEIEAELSALLGGPAAPPQETEALIDRHAVTEKAVELAENHGIIFLDEIDKVCGPSSAHGPDVSRQGVQRDLLPVVEGTTVNTRYGPVRTDHILFIAAGAFHLSKPSDLMPELQGRFPIRVELTDLKREDFLRILTEPKHSLTKQYAELMATEGVTLDFAPDGIEAVADIAFEVNRTAQNIGARRLQTILERVVEEVSYDGPDRQDKHVVIDAKYVRGRLAEVLQKEDLSKFIL